MSVLESVQTSFLGGPLRGLQSRLSAVKWRMDGRPMPLPHHRKRAILRDTARSIGAKHFIETGTYRGDTALQMADVVDRVTTIEIDPRLANLAQKRCGSRSIRVLQGNSAEVLGEVIEDRGDKCLFWLDGHYSGGVTGGEDVGVPVMDELSAILPTLNDGELILIDDAREFVGGIYPTPEQIRELVVAHRPSLSVHLGFDVIAIGSSACISATGFRSAREIK